VEMERRAYPELAIHFHIYQGPHVLLEWHDAFTQPMLLSGEFNEEQIRGFCEKTGLLYSHWKSSVEPAAGGNAG
jgi:hypothetical protein